MNIAEILKNAPKGTKLWSPIFGEVTLIEIDDKSPFPILVKYMDNSIKGFTKDGKFYVGYPDADCVLFPSKENRDWSTFKVDKQLLPVDTPVMVSQAMPYLVFRYYAYENKCWADGYKSNKTDYAIPWDIIIPFDKFNPNDIEESLKYNILNNKQP